MSSAAAIRQKKEMLNGSFPACKDSLLLKIRVAKCQFVFLRIWKKYSFLLKIENNFSNTVHFSNLKKNKNENLNFRNPKMKSRDVIELFQWSEKAWNNTYEDFVKEIKGQFPGKHFISGNNAAKKRFKSFLET